MSTATEPFEVWAIVEIMGHTKHAGKVTEQAIGGCSFVRIDVPESEGRQAVTKLYTQAAIFSITPVSEEVARGVAKQLRSEPIHAWELPEEFRKPRIEQPDSSPECAGCGEPEEYCDCE